MKNLIIASTSTVFGLGYLEYLLPTLKEHFKNADTILFVPYARPGGISHDDYTAKVAEAFAEIDKKVVGLHTFENPIEAVQTAQGIFTGGGNTFLLVKQLYWHNVLLPLREVLQKGTPYLGCSAGSHLTGSSMGPTNDTATVSPPSVPPMAMAPVTRKPQHSDPVEGARHIGETRESRIDELHS